MRLAQIARKVDSKPQEIRKFIHEKFEVELDADPNTKLDDDQVNAILEHFKVEEPEEQSKKEEETEEVVEDIIDPTIETDIESLKEIAEEEAGDTKIEIPDVNKEDNPESEENSDDEKKDTPKKVVTIKHDEGDDAGETAEEDPKSFEEVEVDREAELIAAEVDKLKGIKVVGKIDLSEPEPEEEDLPTADAIEDEIDQLDGDVDTSEFPDLTESNSDEEKEAIFAELDAQMDQNKGGVQKVKQVTNEASEVNENIEVEEDENSIYKNKRGDYRFTTEQRKNREKSLAIKAEKAKIKAQKEKKKRHYEENVAAKVKPKSKKKKQKPSKKSAAKAQKEEPKGLWQKFLNWLND